VRWDKAEQILDSLRQLDRALLALDPAANSEDHRAVLLDDDGKSILIPVAGETME